MKRVLCIVGMMTADGAETYLMKLMRSLDKEKYQMDFCVATNEEAFYDKEIESLGGKIYRVTPKTKGFFKNFTEIKKIVKNNKYQYVLRVSQHSLSSLELLAARFGGAKICAFRSSNTNTCGGRINTLIHFLFRPLGNLFSNVKIAPSTESAIFMFGKRFVNRGKAIILPNALDFDMYKYCSEARSRIRSELRISDDTIIFGNVGRLNYQKNHKFLINIFKELNLAIPNSKLLLVGDGELKNELIDYCSKNNLQDKVLFLGVRNDVGSLLSAMDLFLFPSLFEGMPNTVIEAQANGLKCIISNTLTPEANVTKSVVYLPITNVDYWVNDILENELSDMSHRDYKNIFSEKGYLIDNAVRIFEQVIFRDKADA